MKLFVTGGTGFIGSNFLNAASAAGHELVAHRRAGSTPRVPLAQEPQWHETGLDQLSPGDFEGCEAVVHFASVGVSPQVATWDELLRGNVLVQNHLMTQAHSGGVRRFVLAGSFAEYGRSADSHEFIPPTAPLLPTYGYAAAKACGFVSAHAMAVEQSLELAYLRIFSAFGDGQFNANFWPALKAAALSGQDFPMTAGEQVRDYIPVEKVAQAFLAALASPITPGMPVVANVGSGKPTTMLEFAQHWWLKWQATGQLRPGAVPYRRAEVMRFVPELGTKEAPRTEESRP
ncbi:N/A [soil metagenome]